MSQAPRGPPGFGGGPSGQEYERKGSVRRAREMLEAGFVREARIQALEPDGDRAGSGSPEGTQSRRRPPIVAAFAARGNQKTGLTISKPSPMPQWPLPDEAQSRQGMPNLPDSSFVPKGPPPRRPRRPSNVPSLLDSSRIQDITPNFAYSSPQVPSTSQAEEREQQPDFDPMEVYLSPPSTGKTARRSGESETSRQSTSSSVGSIPEFPLPATQPPTTTPSRRSQNLGSQQTSTRRGLSFPFSQGSFISPIPEELSEGPTRKGESYASSAVIPSSWSSGPPESELLGPFSPSSSSADTYNALGSPESNNEGDSMLLRQASVGQRGKPALRTINRSRSDQSTLPLDQFVFDTGPVGASVADSQSTKPGARISYALSNSGVSDSKYPSDASGFDAPFFLDESRRTFSPIEQGAVSMNQNNGMDTTKAASPVEGVSDRRPGFRRPPRLNMDAVREAEARGSLTSLPDLIRRATTLASNLDRGKTASKLGTLDMLNNSGEFRIPSPAASDRRASESISGILASFPPPGLPTPPADQYDSWPLPPDTSKSRDLQTSESARGLADAQRPPNPTSKHRRRCCGMPLWAFVTVCIVVLLLIAAAIIIPVVLIVLPRERKAAQPAATVPTTNPCQGTFQCMNGGVTIRNGNTCSCVCANGFTGKQCTIAGDGSCVTTAVGGSQNATLGSALPRLFQQSEANFSIPLSAVQILSLFSASSVSCTTENALVSFGGSSQKRRSLGALQAIEESILEPQIARLRHLALDDRHVSHGALSARFAPSDISHITFDTSATTTSTATKTLSSPSATTGTPQPTATSLSTAVALRILNFSRIAVLFILEASQTLDAAIKAQEQIQSFLTDMPTSSSNKDYTMGLNGADMPLGFVLDFEKFTITLSNGTIVGGGTGGIAASSSQTTSSAASSA